MHTTAKCRRIDGSRTITHVANTVQIVGRSSRLRIERHFKTRFKEDDAGCARCGISAEASGAARQHEVGRGCGEREPVSTRMEPELAAEVVTIGYQRYVNSARRAMMHAASEPRMSMNTK